MQGREILIVITVSAILLVMTMWFCLRLYNEKYDPNIDEESDMSNMSDMSNDELITMNENVTEDYQNKCSPSLQYSYNPYVLQPVYTLNSHVNTIPSYVPTQTYVHNTYPIYYV